MNQIDYAKAVDQLPLTVLLALVLIGGYVEWWVYGTIHRREIMALEKQLIEAQGRAARWEQLYLSLKDEREEHTHV